MSCQVLSKKLALSWDSDWMSPPEHRMILKTEGLFQSLVYSYNTGKTLVFNGKSNIYIYIHIYIYIDSLVSYVTISQLLLLWNWEPLSAALLNQCAGDISKLFALARRSQQETAQDLNLIFSEADWNSHFALRNACIKHSGASNDNYALRSAWAPMQWK